MESRAATSRVSGGKESPFTYVIVYKFYFNSILGWRLEDIDKIIQFTAKMSTDPAFSSDVVPKFYLNASLALMYVLYHFAWLLQ